MMRAVLLASFLCTGLAYGGLRAQVAQGQSAEQPQQIQYDDEQFKKEWHNEWKHGDYPSYKETYTQHTFPGRAAIVAEEDDQSDGIPGSAGLSGPDVGAYIKHHPDGTIER